MMPLRLDGKVAVITGACSGIGLATVELFIEEGARVLAADVQAEAGQALAARFPGVLHFVACDVTRPPQIKTAIDTAADCFGGLDILFSNAGAGGSLAGVETWDEAGWTPPRPCCCARWRQAPRTPCRT
jgi:NAD(P)-dependent dehydrogenase (short-subunit alcohol dehydrogenase family)